MTRPLPEPAREPWDVAVVGAGVAGAVAAFRLARRGLAVLLVDKADWPRNKVCGGCVNAAALQMLQASGLDGAAAAGQAYSAMRMAASGRDAQFALPAGRAISRREFDAALVEAARAAGVSFMSATRAALGDCDAQSRWLHLRRADEQVATRARIVLACDGLGGRLFGGDAEVAPASRIGAGTILDAATAPALADYPPGVIHMACAPDGYVGLVRVENDDLNIGAALDPAWVKRVGGPPAAVAHILESAGLPPIDGLDRARWRGTPHLTRRYPRLGAERLLALGDAAGYVEPFTGEGMAWAIASAAAIEPFAVTDWRDGLIDQWTARHRDLVSSRQRACRGVAALLRRPRLVSGAVRMAAAAPIAAAPLTAWLNRDFRLQTAKAVAL
ncbi:MAG TPA: FAD-dependent oxidoreductase [Gammaproteobacteria bacterium]|nr:FAD-dependent oxidoreductase [Gammaproteobacteria bacterium]